MAQIPASINSTLDRYGAREPPVDLSEVGVLEAAAHLRRGRFSARELLDACEARIAQVNGGKPSFYGAPDAINAWIRLYPELARRHADEADRRLRRESDAPLLCGIPLALKDVYAAAGLPLTASSRVLDGNVAESDSAAWARLRTAGTVLVGHTHTHEFAFGGTCDQVGNPWDLSRIPGGSSGGSAAAVAARMVPAATGTDTIGSVRLPAALCGVSGIKPTRGRVPLEGLVACAPSLDTAGSLARGVADCAAVLEAMLDGRQDVLAQAPPGAPTDLPLAPRPGTQPLRGVTIAITDRIDASALDHDTAAGWEAARKSVERLGARVVQRAAPRVKAAFEDVVLILGAEASAIHAPFADRRDGYRPGIRAALEMLDSAPPVAAYIAAQRRRDELAATWEEWMAENEIDLVLEPTVPMVAYPRGDGRDYTPHNPLGPFAFEWNMTGHPVVSLPVGLGTDTGLPVGVSLVARRGREDIAVQAGIDVQEHDLAPPVWPSAQ